MRNYVPRYLAASLAFSISVAVMLPFAARSDTLVLTGEALRACLCEEQAMPALQSDMNQKAKAFDVAHAQIDAVKQEIATRRAAMNVNDPAQVAAYRQLVDHQAALQSALDRQTYPAYRMSVGQYDGLVMRYRNQCAGRTRYQSDVNAITSAGLVCAPQP